MLLSGVVTLSSALPSAVMQSSWMPSTTVLLKAAHKVSGTGFPHMILPFI